MKVTVLLYVTKEMIWRNIFLVRENFSYFHTVYLLHVPILRFHEVEMYDWNLPWNKKFCEIDHILTSFVKTLISRNFCRKGWTWISVNNFHTVIKAPSSRFCVKKTFYQPMHLIYTKVLRQNPARNSRISTQQCPNYISS